MDEDEEIASSTEEAESPPPRRLFQKMKQRLLIGLRSIYSQRTNYTVTPKLLCQISCSASYGQDWKFRKEISCTDCEEFVELHQHEKRQYR